MSSVLKSNNSEIDDERLAFFMAPFRKDRSTNPLSWDSKMKFWADSIRDYCLKNRQLVFNAKSLPEKLKKNSSVPQCLNVVLHEMLRNRSLQSLSDFSSACNTGWLSWTFNSLVTKPVKWGYNTFLKGSLSWVYSWATGGDGNDGYVFDLYSHQRRLPDEEFVLVDLVKEAASNVYAHHNNNVMYDVTDNVVSYDVLQRQCHHICSDEKSFEVAILELCRQKLCCVKVNADGDKVLIFIFE
ncbi:hypothetical protein HELRODRAFT_164645 [Helobdella robusta]|uniref:CHMP7 winged helix domain-containing protein n=1 Tax=Helobdella robusta TaxID=6412 RepID=T1EVP0_HELRO|nr:hypothetical protein HELRODRAFT_164645 [Helobdella robusta]ESN92573.1 hypothetical protein HELRODRAFT_164645 [Helobdella robusta]